MHAYIIHYHDPTDFIMGGSKEVLSLQMSRDHGREMPFLIVFDTLIFIYFYFYLKIFFIIARKERKKGDKVKHKESFQNWLLGTYIAKIGTTTF